MARSIGMAKDATVFRAVITKQLRDGKTVTDYEGPYGPPSSQRLRGVLPRWRPVPGDAGISCGPGSGLLRAWHVVAVPARGGRGCGRSGGAVPVPYA